MDNVFIKILHGKRALRGKVGDIVLVERSRAEAFVSARLAEFVNEKDNTKKRVKNESKQRTDPEVG